MRGPLKKVQPETLLRSSKEIGSIDSKYDTIPKRAVNAKSILRRNPSSGRRCTNFFSKLFLDRCPKGRNRSSRFSNRFAQGILKACYDAI